MAKKYKVINNTKIELTVNVTDEMVKDYKECERISKETAFEEGKDCKSCSWKDTEIGNVCMCELINLD